MLLPPDVVDQQSLCHPSHRTGRLCSQWIQCCNKLSNICMQKMRRQWTGNFVFFSFIHNSMPATIIHTSSIPMCCLLCIASPILFSSIIKFSHFVYLNKLAQQILRLLSCYYHSIQCCWSSCISWWGNIAIIHYGFHVSADGGFQIMPSCMVFVAFLSFALQGSPYWLFSFDSGGHCVC